MHSEGIMAGELKHGPLALVDNDMPVIMVIMRDGCYIKCHNALQQVTARQVRHTFMPALGQARFWKELCYHVLSLYHFWPRMIHTTLHPCSPDTISPKPV